MKPYYRVENERFDTLTDAQQRAEDLAAKFPGRSFEILRCVGYASTSKVSTFWMDGEGPPEKPRYRMLEMGEMIQDGDEFTRTGFDWRRTECDGFRFAEHHHPHRRPL